MVFSYKRAIHCWGGLGSQFYAIALALELKTRFPKFELIFHNSGVTKRELEAREFVSKYFPIQTVDDFVNIGVSDTSLVKSGIEIRSLVKKFVLVIGVISESNNDSQFNHIHPWVKHFRGHYSSRLISPKVIQQMTRDFLNEYDHLNQNHSVVCHYRLDDIVNMVGKTVVSSERITSALSEIPVTSKIAFYSDSLEQVRERLSGKINQEYELHDSNTEGLIVNAVASDVFVGTVSKVSFWIIFFRLAMEKDSVNLMPVESKFHLANAMGDLYRFKNLTFY
jgi:hypothetical protein